MMDFHPKTMVMVSKAEAYRTRNRPQGVRITLDNGWLTLDWPQTVQQRLRTSAVACPATLTVQICPLFHVLASQEPSRLIVKLYDPRDPNEKPHS
jgi:hypothetical protein